MALDSIGSASGAINTLRNLDSINRTDQTRGTPPPASTDGDIRVSDAAVTDVRQTEQQTLDTLRQGLSEASAVGNVALAGARSVSDNLDQIGEWLQQLTDPRLAADQRATLTTEIEGLVRQGLDTVDRASFNDVNLLDASRNQDVEVTAGRDGGTATVRDQDLRTGLETLQGLDLSTAESAQSALNSVFAEVRTTTNTAVDNLTEDTRRIDERNQDVQRLQAQVPTPDENVDATLDANGALQIANQLQQALGGQSLGIVNQRPETLVGLFR